MSHTLTLAEAEAACREFAAEFDLPNVRQAIAMAEAGRITWFELYDISRDALSAGNKAVGR